MKRRSSVIVLMINLAILIFLGLLFFNNGMTGFAVSNLGNYRVYVLNAYAGKDVNFVIPIDNGNKEIKSAYAEITIIDSKGNQVALLKTDEISIAPNKSAELEATWKNSSSEGVYQARILIFNDNVSYGFSKNFNLEIETLTFESVVIKHFDLGDVANLSVLIQNHLNESLSNVSISILLLDNSGNPLSELVSETKDIGANSLSQFGIIWDTKGIEPGEYNAKMTINYGESVIDKDLVIDINKDSFDVVGVGYSVAMQPNQSQGNYLVFLLVGLLVLGNLAWIIYYTRSKTHSKK